MNVKDIIVASLSSTTVRWSVFQVILGVALAVAAHYGLIDQTWNGYGWTLVAAGFAISGGRVLQGASPSFAEEKPHDKPQTATKAKS